ncbi:hypothetical protein SASPL_112515 [Salvia splendens]|uniref:Leucine-rich PPR motif-containing protein, mitochondrial n=1 Tax=Salvia splendens TaxID=180675 RepID=A0A8X9A656_SALSN|nr:hypothetical protein SASPL_112515 [Salvia splendens]
MEYLHFARSESLLVKTVCAIVVKGYWDKLLKPKIGSSVTSSVINQVLSEFSANGFSVSWAAQNLVEKIARRDFLLSPTVLNALVNSCSDSDVNAHVLSWLVIFYADSKMSSEAVQVFEHMRVCGYKPHVHACIVLLNSLVKEGLTNLRDAEKVEELLIEMESNNVVPDIFTYNTLISLYCKKGMHYEALCVQDRMERGGVCPDIVTYNSLVYSYCREDRMREALRLFKEIKGAAPNHVTYTTLIDGYCRVGDIGKVLQLRGEMEASGLFPGVVTYNALLRKLCEEGRMGDANKILNEMGDRKIEPDVVTCNTLINAYCKIGDMRSALKFRNRMLEAGLRPDQFTYKALIHGYCKSKEINSAKEINDDEAILALLDELVQGGICVDISVYRAMIRRLCKKEGIGCAERVFGAMQTREILGDTVIYSSLAYAHFRVGDAVSASAFLD